MTVLIHQLEKTVEQGRDDRRIIKQMIIIDDEQVIILYTFIEFIG